MFKFCTANRKQCLIAQTFCHSVVAFIGFTLIACHARAELNNSSGSLQCSQAFEKPTNEHIVKAEVAAKPEAPLPSAILKALYATYEDARQGLYGFTSVLASRTMTESFVLKEAKLSLWQRMFSRPDKQIKISSEQAAFDKLQAYKEQSDSTYHYYLSNITKVQAVLEKAWNECNNDDCRDFMIVHLAPKYLGHIRFNDDYTYGNFQVPHLSDYDLKKGKPEELVKLYQWFIQQKAGENQIQTYISLKDYPTMYLSKGRAIQYIQKNIETNITTARELEKAVLSGAANSQVERLATRYMDQLSHWVSPEKIHPNPLEFLISKSKRHALLYEDQSLLVSMIENLQSTISNLEWAHAFCLKNQKELVHGSYLPAYHKLLTHVSGMKDFYQVWISQEEKAETLENAQKWQLPGESDLQRRGILALPASSVTTQSRNLTLENLKQLNLDFSGDPQKYREAFDAYTRITSTFTTISFQYTDLSGRFGQMLSDINQHLKRYEGNSQDQNPSQDSLVLNRLISELSKFESLWLENEKYIRQIVAMLGELEKQLIQMHSKEIDINGKISIANTLSDLEKNLSLAAIQTIYLPIMENNITSLNLSLETQARQNGVSVFQNRMTPGN